VFLAAAASVLSAPRVVAQGTAPKAQTDLDRFMARVLERRDENWKTLHDYILSETERFDLYGPGRARLNGFRREYSWYVRDGYLIRSPLRFDGVAIPEPERRQFEARWLADEQAREARQKKEKTGRAGGQARADEAPAAAAEAGSLEALVPNRLEPRFVSEAYFLGFTFEPGNYYFVGREVVDGREVVRIEYYPTRLFQDEERQRPRPREAGGADKRTDKERERDARIERSLDKTSVVTLWVEPTECQIVRYTFENVDLGFLPGRWFIRVDDMVASMTMGKVLGGVWLPRTMSVAAGFSLASGTYRAEYGREFSDHKKAEVSARIRIIRGPER
jgi:hypothetical protein